MYNNLKIFILSIFLFIYSFSLVHASETLNISSFPTSKNAGEEFDINFTAIGLTSSASYYMKGLGGNTTTTSFTEIDTWNNGWVQQNGSWVSMPTFSANAEGSASATLKVRFDPNVATNNKDFKLRIRKTDSDINIDSNIVGISVTAVTPSPTSVPTATPTKTPSPAPTAAPTTKPVVKTATPKPTQTSEPTEETKIEEAISTNIEVTQTSTPEPLVLGENIEKKKVPIIAYVFIVLGLGFLGYVVYLIYNQKNAKL